MSKARTSGWLTEIRTIHSRAVSALDRLDWLEGPGQNPIYKSIGLDPDRAEIRADLEQVEQLTRKWSKEKMKS